MVAVIVTCSLNPPEVLRSELLAMCCDIDDWSRRNMQPQVMRLWDRLMLRSRSLLEPSQDQWQHVSQLAPSRPRRLGGFMVNGVGPLSASPYQPTQPSLGWWRGASGLPVVS